MSSIEIKGREYVFGIRRYPLGKRHHLYEGTHRSPGRPLCKYGYTDGYKYGSYSIFRGNRGELGLCKLCEKRAEKGLGGFPHPEWEITKDEV